MAETKRQSRAAPARAPHPESTEAVTPDETTGLSLLVAAGSLAAFMLLGSAPPQGGAIEVTEETHGAAVEPGEHSADSGAPARPESDAPTVKLNELEVEDNAAPPQPDGALAEAQQAPGEAPEPTSEGVAVPKIVLEEEPAETAPTPAAPPAPPSPAAATAPRAPNPPAPAPPPAAPAPKPPVAAAPAPAPQPVTPSQPAKPPAPEAPKAPALPPAPTLAPPVSNPY